MGILSLCGEIGFLTGINAIYPLNHALKYPRRAGSLSKNIGWRCNSSSLVFTNTDKSHPDGVIESVVGMLTLNLFQVARYVLNLGGSGING